MSGQIVQTQMIMFYTICHSVGIFWTHDSMVKSFVIQISVVGFSFLFRVTRKWTCDVTTSLLR